MSNDKLREEFEAWASENRMAMHLARAESGLYVSRVTQNYMDCWMASRAGQEAEVEALRNCVEDLALSLECEVKARYAGTQEHPAIKRKYDGDMQEVLDARKLLSKEAGHD